jgi:hypothetical protein
MFRRAWKQLTRWLNRKTHEESDEVQINPYCWFI